MKKNLFRLSLFLFVLRPVFAQSIALVYESEAAASQGKFAIANVTLDGILVPAQMALKAGNELLAGETGKNLCHASLVRLDNDLGLALLRLGDLVENADLQFMHQQKSKAVTGFLPQAPAAATPTTSFSSATSSPTTETPIVVKINGSPLNAGTIEMKADVLRKSDFKVTIVFPKSEPVWSFSFEMKSDPKLSFWKKGRATGLNDVPRPVFNYDHQALFKPLKDGKSVDIPIEAHYIDKGKPYVWTINIKTKIGTLTQTANVLFH